MNNQIVSEDIDYIHSIVGNCDRFNGAAIVVTGCAGFLGFYFMEFLVRRSYALGISKVIGLDSFLLGRPPWLSELAEGFPKVLTLHVFDIGRDDIGAVDGAMSAKFVIHAASVASPTYYRKYPIETIDANVWGLRNLLDFYRVNGSLEGFLFMSSSEIYGDPDPAFIPTDEEYRGNVSCHGPRACYDEAKRFCETMSWIYANQYKMPITIARPFNNYGPGMRLDDRRLPADFARCVIENRDIVIFSDGTPTRTYCYVSDAIAGYLLCLLYGKYDYFNIGVDTPELSVRDLAAIYLNIGTDLFGYSGNVHYRKSDDPQYMTDNPSRRCPKIRKAREKLGYNPRISIEAGVRRYLQFLKEAK